MKEKQNPELRQKTNPATNLEARLETKEEAAPSPYQHKIFTIPNLLSMFRLALVPIIVWVYVGKNAHILATILIALSGLTDIVDGKIARKFNMVSDLGKVLDPFADKLTQFSMLFCLVSRFYWVWYLLCFFVVKELTQAFMAYVVLRKKESVDSAQWFGKASTATLYGVMIILFVCPIISDTVAMVLCGLAGGMLLLSLILYLRFDIQELRKLKKQGK